MQACDFQMNVGYRAAYIVLFWVEKDNFGQCKVQILAKRGGVVCHTLCSYREKFIFLYALIN